MNRKRVIGIFRKTISDYPYLLREFHPTKNGEGCPKCNIKRLEKGIVFKVDETNSLSSQFPEIAKE